MKDREIYKMLNEQFCPQHLEIIDDSSQHAGHREAQGSEGTHFSVLIVSDIFLGKSLLQRHRLIYESLESAMKDSIHALAIKAYTPEEFQKKSGW